MHDSSVRTHIKELMTVISRRWSTWTEAAAIYVALLLYARLRLSAFASHAGRRIYLSWKMEKGHIKEEEKVRHTHIDFLPTFGFAHFPCRNKRAHQQQHGAWVWCWLWMVKMKKQQSACVRGWMRQKLRSRILMLQNLRVAENLFVDHQRMPIEIKSLELGVIIVVTVSRLSSTSSSFEGNSRDLQQKTWKEVVGVALKEEAAILISFALSHKMMIVITSHTRFHSFTRKGISSLGALEGDESAENSSFKLLSQTSESFFTRICTQIIDWLLRNSEINIA